jgi:hypothetical protein
MWPRALHDPMAERIQLNHSPAGNRTPFSYVLIFRWWQMSHVNKASSTFHLPIADLLFALSLAKYTSWWQCCCRYESELCLLRRANCSGISRDVPLAEYVKLVTNCWTCYLCTFEVLGASTPRSQGKLSELVAWELFHGHPREPDSAYCKHKKGDNR